jgi:hypothetical protein
MDEGDEGVDGHRCKQGSRSHAHRDGVVRRLAVSYDRDVGNALALGVADAGPRGAARTRVQRRRPGCILAICVGSPL